MRKRYIPSLDRRKRIDAAAEILKRVCGLPQKEAFEIAKRACVFNPPKRYAGGKFASGGDY